MANKIKTYSQDVLNSVKEIGEQLSQRQKELKTSLKVLSASSGLSVNSIKAIFEGMTANIASYDSLARALGTSLVQVAGTLHNSSECTPMSSTAMKANKVEVATATAEFQVEPSVTSNQTNKQ